MNYEDEINPTEGEIFIEQFLIENGFSYEAEVKIFGLEGDYKNAYGGTFQYRRADFYLTNFDVFIEYFGKYLTDPEYRMNADRKKRVYEDNGLKCIYIYPENLGNLKYHLEFRLIQLLQTPEQKKKLFWFRFWKVIDKADILLLSIIFLLFPLFPYNTWVIVFLFLFVFGGTRLWAALDSTYKKQKPRTPPFKEIHLGKH